MTTTLTPPPLPPQSGQPAQPGHTPPSERRSSSRVVAIIAICLGAVLVLGTVVTGVISIIRTAAVHTTTLTASIDGIRALDIDARAADVDIVYGDVAEATLRVVGSQGDWVFERQGDTLVVSSDRQWWGRWGWFREGDDVTLTLPTGTRGLDADFDVDEQCVDDEDLGNPGSPPPLNSVTSQDPAAGTYRNPANTTVTIRYYGGPACPP